LRIVLLAVCLGLSGPGRAAGCLPYEPAAVTLTGAMRMASGYGPPGFGETPKIERKEAYALLRLDAPVCISGGSETNEDVAAIRAFQLVSRPGRPFDRALLGSRVAVTGTLYHRVSAAAIPT
jgi:hypothetical protein